MLPVKNLALDESGWALRHVGSQDLLQRLFVPEGRPGGPFGVFSLKGLLVLLLEVGLHPGFGLSARSDRPFLMPRRLPGLSVKIRKDSVPNLYDFQLNDQTL